MLMAESKRYYDELYRIVRDAISGKVTLHIADNVARAVVEGLLKNDVLVLPCALGTEVYCIGTPCGTCRNYNEPFSEEMTEECKACEKREIGKCEFDYDLIPEWKVNVFPTEAEARKVLSERQVLKDEA